MEFNIALNTVIYIMIFIVPGFLFRNSFYRNEFYKEFYFGNLFERFIWTLFFSVLMLLACYVFIAFFLWWGIDVIPEISYETIREIHNSIHQQSDIILPDRDTFFHKSSSFFTLMSILWGQSILLGFVLHNIAVAFNYNFYNYWYALLRGKKNPTPKNFKYSYTQVDILTHNNALYQGKYKNHYLSKSNNDLETVILKKVRKKEKGSYFKAIPGHNFCVHKDDIVNINLSYIYEEYKSQSQSFAAKILKIVGILIYILLTFFFIYMLYTDPIPALNTFPKKIFFFLTIFSISTFFANAALTFKLPAKESVILILLFIWIVFSVYFDFNMSITTSVAITILIGGTYYIYKDEKQTFKSSLTDTNFKSSLTDTKKKIRKPRKPYQRRSYKKKRRERYTRKINR